MPQHSAKSPYITKIKDRKLLSKEGATKKSYQIILDIENAKLEYKPGDSVAIFPQNDPRIVDLTITHMHTSKQETITHPRNGQNILLEEFLTKYANISRVSPGLIKKLNPKIKPENIRPLIQSHHLWDLLKKFSKHKLSSQKICDLLLPILPRLYSISSSSKMYPEEMHLLITHVSYELNGIKRNGVCTEFMCHLSKENTTPIPIYIQPSHGFNLTTNDQAPIIMIGPGCGVAPFRAFLEERFMDQAPGENWLIFGERNSKTDFYYEDFFKDLVSKNKLRLSTAFSRDQKDKIYVQDKLYEHGADVWQWVQHGAHIYVCGDARRMAIDVEKNLIKIFLEQGNLQEAEARDYLYKLREEKRYLKDVY